MALTTKWISIATLILCASNAGAQSSVDALRSGAHIRVWFRPYGLRAHAGTVQSFQRDTLRFRIPGFVDAMTGAADDFIVHVRTLDSLEIGTGRSNKASLKGALLWGLGGGVIGGFAAGFLGADNGTAVGYATVRTFAGMGALIGAVVGAMHARNEAERWMAIPLRPRR